MAGRKQELTGRRIESDIVVAGLTSCIVRMSESSETDLDAPKTGDASVPWSVRYQVEWILGKPKCGAVKGRQSMRSSNSRTLDPPQRFKRTKSSEVRPSTVVINIHADCVMQPKTEDLTRRKRQRVVFESNTAENREPRVDTSGALSETCGPQSSECISKQRLGEQSSNFKSNEVCHATTGIEGAGMYQLRLQCDHKVVLQVLELLNR